MKYRCLVSSGRISHGYVEDGKHIKKESENGEIIDCLDWRLTEKQQTELIESGCAYPPEKLLNEVEEALKSLQIPISSIVWAVNMLEQRERGKRGGRPKSEDRKAAEEEYKSGNYEGLTKWEKAKQIANKLNLGNEEVYKWIDTI